MADLKIIPAPAGLAAFGERSTSGSTGHADYWKNLDSAEKRRIDQTCCCVVCGKPAKGAQFVYLSNVGEYAEAREGNDDSDDLGFYPVGSECMKALQKAGVPVYNRARNARGSMRNA